jgi:hypothetical protein
MDMLDAVEPLRVARAEFVTWALIIQAAVMVAISAAISVTQMLLAPKPKPPGRNPFGRQTGGLVTTAQAINHWRIAYGECRVAGAILYPGSSHANDRYHQVTAVVAHEAHALGTVILGDRPVYDDLLDADGFTTEGWFFGLSRGHVLRVQKKLGTADQTAFADLVADSGGEWSNDHRARGHALVYTTYLFAPGVYPGGPPNVTVIGRWKKVKDVRDGVTRYTPNLALCLRDYLLIPKLLGGFGAAPEECDNDADWIAAANICDEFVASPTTGDAAIMHNAVGVDVANNYVTVDGKILRLQRGDRVEVASTGAVPAGIPSPAYAIPWHELEAYTSPLTPGIPRPPAVKFASSYANALAGTAVDIADAGSGAITITKTGEPRYVLCGAFSTDQNPRKIVEEMLASCGGRLVYAGGKFRLTGLAWEAPALTLHEDDLRASIKVRSKRSRRDRFNALKGTYQNPVNLGQPSDYPAVTAAVYVQQDNDETIFNELDQPYTPRAGQAQRAAKIVLARNRFERTVTFPAKLTAYDCRAGDVIAITNARRGWVAKPFEVLDRKPVIVQGEDGEGPYLGIDLVLNEASEDGYAWASTEEQADPPVIEPTLPDWNHIPSPGAPDIAESLYEGREGSDVKARVTLTWAASGSSLISGYEAEFKLSAASTWTVAGRAPPEIRTIHIDDVDPGIYDLRVRAVTAIGAASEWSTVSNRAILGLAAPPVAITGLTGQSLGGQFILRWTLHADADVRRGGHIEFRHSPSVSGSSASETTTIGDAVDGRTTQAVLPFKDGTYYARALDKLGNAGPWASVSTIGSTVLAWSTIGSVQEDGAFPGTHSSTVKIGSTLTLDGSAAMDSWGLVDDIANWDAEGGIAASGTYTWSAGIDLGSVQRFRARLHILCSTVNILDLIDSRTGNIDDWDDFDGAIAPGAADAWTEIRVTNDDPAGAPTWSAWQRLDVAEFNARAIDRPRTQLRSYDSAYRPEITQLRLFAEDPSL